MQYLSHIDYLKRAIEISKEARASGNTPFGALLVDKEGNIIMEQPNIEITEKFVMDMLKQLLLPMLHTNIPRNFYGIVPYILRQNLVQCALVPFTGRILDELYML